MTYFKDENGFVYCYDDRTAVTMVYKYTKWKISKVTYYELKRKAKKQKQNTQQLKEVQLRVNISEHDLDIKGNQAKKCLVHGDKVTVVLTMRGRELSRRDESKRCILEFLVKLEDVCKIESLRDEGNRTIAILKSK